MDRDILFRMNSIKKPLQTNFEHALSISIRDTETVDRLKTRIKDAKRVLVIGNGGIATEIV